MRITLQSQVYGERTRSFYIDDEKLIGHLQNHIDSGLGKKIKLPKGPTVDLTRTSLMTVAIRQLFNLALPMLVWIANYMGVVPPKKERHADIIKYTLHLYFMVLQKATSDTELVLTTRPYVDELEIIETCEMERENAKMTLFGVPLIENKGL